jgi:hypothetical protein
LHSFGRRVRLVALPAPDDAVRTVEPEFGCGMVESAQPLPGYGGVARLTAGRLPVCPRGPHAAVKLPAVRIPVAGSAKFHSLPELHRLDASWGVASPVAVGARDRLVRAGQLKLSRVVARQPERRRFEARIRMTELATISIGITLELFLVGIPVTGRAGEACDVVSNDFPDGGMALRASHPGMTRLQRKPGRGMPRGIEGRGLEPCDFVACRTVSAVRTLNKLAAVGILPVAIGAAIVSYRFLEVSLVVARGARHAGMLAQERVFRLEMVEDGGDVGRFPARSGLMTRTAGGSERAAVRVPVAWRAVFVRYASVLRVRLGISRPGVALLTGCLFMRAREHETRPIVVESGSIFPAGGVVAAGALP